MKIKCLINFKAGKPQRLSQENPFWQKGQVVEGAELERLLEAKSLDFLLENKFVEVLPEPEEGEEGDKEPGAPGEDLPGEGEDLECSEGENLNPEPEASPEPNLASVEPEKSPETQPQKKGKKAKGN